MAKITKNTEEIIKWVPATLVTTEVNTYTLEFNEATAKALAVVLGSVGGSKDGPRGLMDSIYRELESFGFHYHSAGYEPVGNHTFVMLPDTF